MEQYANSYKDLQVFQKAYQLSLEIHKVTIGFPIQEQFDITRQIRRASKSICANIAEGYAKQAYSKAEFKRFISISVGSSDEMQVWIQYSSDLGYIGQGHTFRWQQGYIEISKMLHALHKKI